MGIEDELFVDGSIVGCPISRRIRLERQAANGKIYSDPNYILSRFSAGALRARWKRNSSWLLPESSGHFPLPTVRGLGGVGNSKRASASFIAGTANGELSMIIFIPFSVTTQVVSIGFKMSILYENTG